ncbi:MAG TPA: SRPBCC family protein [Stellaceae bacterium]|nr:SRPBCC family protein [Stellaceae bacterium]
MKPQPATPNPFTNYPEALVDPELFRAEQDKLARVWTFLGFTHHVAKDGDWFRAAIATRSVFVQRFGAELRAFENRCAHRSFPLRNADRGNGPVVCGFHHWRYDKEGRAVGIPQCQPLFGVAPAELGARLMPVEIATCGSLIFGRFRGSGDNQTLEQFLGESFDVLKAVSNARTAPRLVKRVVEANWRLCFHANVEDYHPPVIHPETFGRHGYPNPDKVGYFRFGWHSAFFDDAAPDALKTMAAECRAETWRSANYRVFHIFPDLTISHLRAHWETWFIVFVQYRPLSPGRSMMHAWFYPAPFATAEPAAWYDLATRPFTDLFRKIAMPYVVGMVLGQDNVICEGQQSIARQLSPAPLLGALEERLAWYEEAYTECMQAR